LRKSGASLDLAMAMGILVGSEQVKANGHWAVLGELSLGGELRSVPGLLPMVVALADRRVRRIVVPADGLDEARLAAGVDVVGVATLAEAATALREGRRGGTRTRPPRVDLAEMLLRERAGEARAGTRDSRTDIGPDLSEVRGQLEARRALEIALAGGHCMVMIGPPGSGKTLLARTVPGLLPPLADSEARMATIIASVAGHLPVRSLVRERPFRAPHHTISYAAMVGGGPHLSPGEVTLANDGVLFLDELPEFDRTTLESLRQPLEDGRVAIARVGRAAVFPARFQLIGAMNPCPCGFAESGDGRCRCQPGVVERYASRISGPLRDRVDLWVRMPRVEPNDYLRSAIPEESGVVASRIEAARRLQLDRGGVPNARLSGRRLRAACSLGPAEQDYAVKLAQLQGWSARGIERLLRVARTAADLACCGRVEAVHLEEAARFRGPSDSRVDSQAVV